MSAHHLCPKWILQRLQKANYNVAVRVTFEGETNAISNYTKTFHFIMQNPETLEKQVSVSQWFCETVHLLTAMVKEYR